MQKRETNFYAVLIVAVAIGYCASGQQDYTTYRGCGGNLDEMNALIMTPDYPETEEQIGQKYPNNMTCTWHKNTTNGNSTNNNDLYIIKFWDIFMERRAVGAGTNETACYDYINVTIESIGTEMICDQYTNANAVKRTIRGVGPTLTITFHSDESDTYRGAMIGYQTIPSFDPCAREPCVFGECILKENRIEFKCECHSGYTGFNCDVDFDECASDPCENGGTCRQLLGGGFTCLCLDDFEGMTCSIDKNANPCDSHTCARGSTCEVDGNSYICICKAGVTGRYCKEEIDECASDPCGNNGICVDYVNSYECTCKDGWVGTHCDKKDDGCADDPCFENEICNATLKWPGFICSCMKGWTGQDCQEDINECESTPCQNDGECLQVDQVDWYTCRCKSGYSGTNCEIAEPKCKNPGIPYLSEDKLFTQGATLQFYCSDGYRMAGFENLTCLQNTTWSHKMPACVVDELNNTVLFLPRQLTPTLKTLITMSTALTISLISFSIWLVLKGPWEFGKNVTKVVRL